MKIMLDCSEEKIKLYSKKYEYDFWQLRTPLTRYKIANVPWALDNGCFSNFEYTAWSKMLDEADDLSCKFNNPHPPIFVTLPDCVGNAKRTKELFDFFYLQTVGLPRALVLQDGIEKIDIPWKEISAVFVGGSDDFKISKEVFDICRVAKMLKKWVHIGRVNTTKRALDWVEIADSCDGSGMSRFDARLEEVLNVIKFEKKQIDLL